MLYIAKHRGLCSGLTLVFLAISVAGPGMHLLPGCGHQHVRQAATHSHTDHHHTDHHHTGCGHHHSSEQPFSPRDDSIASQHDCAICNFFAQSQDSTYPEIILSAVLHTAIRTERNSPNPPMRFVAVYAARAPPSTA